MHRYDCDHSLLSVHVTKCAGSSLECRISVVVPAHNDEDYLESCIQSLMAQTVLPDEIIICDDASLDGTRDIAIRLAERYPDKIHCIFHEENRGCGGNFNSGIRAARGCYVSIVAADDYWLPQKLERELEALEASDRRWAYSIVELAWEDGPHAGHQMPFWGTVEGHDGDLFQDILLRRVSPRNFLIERKLLLEAGGFDEAFGMYEDWDLKLRLSARYPAAFVAETGAIYRQHSQGISRSDLQRQLAEAGKVLRKNKLLIERFAPERATALRDSAWQKLLPGGKEEKNVPASLSMDYSPRRLDRRGGGLVFLSEGDDAPLRVALMGHPDLFCPPVLPIVEDLLTGMMTNAQEARVTQEAARAGLYAAWSRQLKESGLSRMLVCTRLAPEAAERLHRIFPDAKFVVSGKQGVSGSLAESAQLVLMGQVAGEAALDSLCEALDLPRLFRPIQSTDKNYSRAADLIHLGEQQFAAGGLDAAEASFREALVCNAAAVDAYNNLAVVSWQRHDLAGALDLLSQGLALDSRHLDLLENTARILFEAGHHDDSEIFCKQYLAINPDNTDMAQLLGQVQRATG
ncbi:glycosyltransferase [Pseudomonadota bacterium]